MQFIALFLIFWPVLDLTTHFVQLQFRLLCNLLTRQSTIFVFSSFLFAKDMLIADKDSVIRKTRRANGMPRSVSPKIVNPLQNTESGCALPTKPINFLMFPSLFPEQEAGDQTPVSPAPTPPPRKAKAIERASSLDAFVVGVSNQLAHKAAELAIFHPGQISPIFIFGPTSVGKTLLLEAIAKDISADKSKKKPLLLAAEQFTSAFIDAISHSGMPGFRNKFRDISALLIDDIHFFVGKDKTQSEFLSLIDSLNKQGVQIVLTGDRSLRNMCGLRPELIARLSAGMTCEIGMPEREILLTIFQNWVKQRQLPISDEISRFVVARVNSHARQLAGALNLLHAYFLTNNKPITIPIAEKVLEELFRNNRRTVNLQDIEKAVCETYNLSAKSLASKSKAKHVAQPRMLAMWLARKHTKSALSEIGQFFGNRCHSTVISAEKKVNKLLDSPEFADSLQRIERILNAV